MKKILILILTLMSIPAISNAEENIELNITRDSETQWTLSVALNNEQTYAGFQMDFVLPQQFTVATDSIKKATRLKNITMEASVLASGNLRIVGYGSTAKKNITGTSGELLTVQLTSASAITPGDYKITAKNIRFSNTTEENVLPGVSLTFNVAELAKHTVNYWNGETLLKSLTLTEGATVPTIDAPEAKDGYAFDGWSDSTTVMPDHDLNIYAKWKQLTFTIKYWNGETLFKTITVGAGDPIPTVETPEAAEGYVFDGWSDSTAVMPTHNLDIYAKWKQQTYTVSYIVNGTTIHTEQVAYGDMVKLYDYTPDGSHVFIQWIGDSYETMPAHDISYEAQLALLGDVDLDGNVNSSDVVAIYNYIMSGESSGIIEACADIDGDGKINSADIVAEYNVITYGTQPASKAYHRALTDALK